MKMSSSGGIACGAAMFVAAVPLAAENVLWNPTDRAYENALVRLKAEAPSESFVVRLDGKDLPYQVEESAGRKWIWVCADFAAGASNRFEVAAGKPAKAAPRVMVRQEGDAYLLDNGLAAIKVAAEPAAAMDGPILGIRLPCGGWAGRTKWKTGLALRRFRAEVIGDGTLFGKVRLRYEFDGKAGASGNEAAFAEMDITLGPGWQHAEIAERHEMPTGDYWEFDAAHGWGPTQGRSKPFSQGPGSGWVDFAAPPDRPLAPGKLAFQSPELFISLLPRWNQHYKDGWFFAVTNAEMAVGVMPVLAGQWVWPHDNALDIIVKDTGDYAGVRCPLRRGARLWWLLSGTADSPAGTANLEYFNRYAFENLDKINRDFMLGWEGKKGGWFRINPYDGGQINPTGAMRGLRRALIPKAGQEGDLSTLYQAQVYFHPDTYGTSWNFWSPENPNFFTDYIHVPVLLTTQLKKHPRFEELRRLAEARVHEDVHHSFTLPGGAGQECPGYMAGAWNDDDDILKTHLGFDPAQWDRMKARASFKKRISQPDGSKRRTLPMGDTHPGPDGPKVEDVPADEVARFTTEELPGFGVIFNHRPGTPRETYLSFKAGPNRGHYHGDPLSVVACFDAEPAAVDHFCSYRPRSGQEHMHNRVAFFTEEEPYLNMDGYERLIAFKTSEAADVAMGQVESDRLRVTNSQAPEFWDRRWPLVQLTSPLVYRRTVVFVKGNERDAVVLRDQYRSPVELGAAFCLHSPDDVLVFQSGTNGAGALQDGAMVLADPAQDFEKMGVMPGWVLDVGSRVHGKEDPFTERYGIRSVKGGAITVDRPIQAGHNRPYTIYRDTLKREGNSVRVGRVMVTCVAPKVSYVRAFPWRHDNGGGESTQGVRLETRGAEGEFITVLTAAGAKVAVEAVAGGVKVDGTEVVFADGWDATGGAAVVRVRREGREVVTLGANDIDLDRSQGDIGLFVPDAGYPFGEIPDWLVRQRAKRPAWYEEYLAWRARQSERGGQR